MRKLESVVATIVVAPALETQVGKAPCHAEVSSHGEVHTDSQNIRAHVKFLSSDLLEGRRTGQRGGDIAADYIATQFALCGLKSQEITGLIFRTCPWWESRLSIRRLHF